MLHIILVFTCITGSFQMKFERNAESCRYPDSMHLSKVLENSKQEYELEVLQNLMKDRKDKSEFKELLSLLDSNLAKSINGPSKRETFSSFCTEKIKTEENKNLYPSYNRIMECDLHEMFKGVFNGYECAVVYDHELVLRKQECDSDGMYKFEPVFKKKPLYCKLEKI